ncbi:MAG: T9SS type A sorting domain-containing protein [Bacteroidales bacterium]|nr:T9SS type A sorting domain-containing protein [Bacteroidales bacterium]
MKKFTHIFSVLIVFVLTLSASSSFAVKHTVLVGNFYFNPSNIPDVQVGDTIHWQWVEGSHTTTSTSVPAGAATWDSPMTSGNQVFEYKVTVAGMYNYKCTPHSGIQTGSFTAVGAPPPSLTVTPSNQNVSAEAGSTSFSVTSNSAWNTSSDKTWCTVSPTSGNGNGTITANYSENTTTATRVATITITVAGLSPQMVTVTQNGAALTLMVSPENQDVTSSSGSTMFDVTTNTNWTAMSDASWCTVSPSGTGNGTITATYTENPSANSRMAEITVTGDGILTEKVTVTQEGSGLGIEYKAENTFAIYPNPTSGIVNLVPGDVSNINMEACILDITGKTLKSEILSGSSKYQMNISNLPEGIYFVRVKDGERIVTKRIVRSN